MPRTLSKELEKIGKELGVEIEPSYDHPDQVDSVKFDFPPKVWADLANKEGKLLPACCANVSAMRDILIDAMREDGLIKAEYMQRFVINMADHSYGADHPATKVATVYNRLEKFIKLRDLMMTDLKNPRDVACNVWFGEIFKFCAEYGNRSMFSTWGEEPHDVAQHNKMLFEVLPTIKALSDHIRETGLPPVEGYAILNQATGHIYEMYRGLAIFMKKEEALDILSKWIETEQLKPDTAEVRAVRVSWEKGLEKLDVVPTKWTRPLPKAPKKEIEFVTKVIEDLVLKAKIVKDKKIKAIFENALRKVRALEDHSGPTEL